MEKSRPLLTIDLPENEEKRQMEETDSMDPVYVRPLFSAKHSRRPIPTHIFQSPVPPRVCKPRNPQSDRDLLLSSLKVLKGGAVSAIAEKQEEIEQLKGQLCCQDDPERQGELRQLRAERDSLKEEIEELEERLAGQRESYMRLLQEKDQVIEQLYVELGSSQIEIEKLEKCEEIKQRKIKIIEEENNALFHELETEKITHLGQLHVSEDNEDDTRDKSQEILTTQQDELQLKIEQMERKHRMQMNELTIFYERRMAQTRDLYERQLQEWPTSSCQKQLSFHPIQEAPSIRETLWQPHQLSNQLGNARMLSDCYSLTKRHHLSKIDSDSQCTHQLETPDPNFKFLKRVTQAPRPASPNSHTTATQSPQIFTTPVLNTPVKKEEEAENKKGMGWFWVGTAVGGCGAWLLNRLLK